MSSWIEVSQSAPFFGFEARQDSYVTVALIGTLRKNRKILSPLRKLRSERIFTIFPPRSDIRASPLKHPRSHA